MARIEKLLHFLKEEMGQERKVIKSLPMRPEWAKNWKDLRAATKVAEEAEAKRTALKKQFWSRVELDLNEYGEMGVNRDTNEVEIYAENPDDED